MQMLKQQMFFSRNLRKERDFSGSPMVKTPFPPAQQAPGTLSLSHSPRNDLLSPLKASHVLTDNLAMCHFLRRPSPMSLAGRHFSNGTCSKACITARSLQLLGKHLLCQAAGVRDSSASFTDRS